MGHPQSCLTTEAQLLFTHILPFSSRELVLFAGKSVCRMEPQRPLGDSQGNIHPPGPAGAIFWSET